jgi:hypothetical protein
MLAGIRDIFVTHWPELFGLEPQPLTDFGIESTGRQGLAGAAWLLLPVIGIPAVRIAMRAIRRGSTTSASPFSRYLVVVAVLSIAGYLVGRCGVVDFYTMRYELMSVLGAVGLGAWFLRDERSRTIRTVWLASCAAVFLLAGSAHVRLIAEYLTHPPVPAKRELIDALDARGVHHAYGDYWTSYYVTFLTRERIIVASTEVPKVRTHNREVDAHRDQAIAILRHKCVGGEQLTRVFWACRP